MRSWRERRSPICPVRNGHLLRWTYLFPFLPTLDPMIEYETGDILLADVQALVNTVNCVGVMGKGIALQFKQTFPENVREYKKVCDRGDLEPGRLFVFDRGELFEGDQEPQYVINFPTKTHWRKPSKLEYIEQGMDALVEEVRQRDIESIAIPPPRLWKRRPGLGGRRSHH